MLEMKNEFLDCDCELSNDSEVHICSYECTYCAKCAEQTGFICKNCGGDCQQRPKRGQS